MGAYRGIVGAHKRFGGADARSVDAPKRSVRASRPPVSAANRFGRTSESPVRTLECFVGTLEPSMVAHEGFVSVAFSGLILLVPRTRNETGDTLSVACQSDQNYQRQQQRYGRKTGQNLYQNRPCAFVTRRTAASLVGAS